jgi:hypothetical protein
MTAPNAALRRLLHGRPAPPPAGERCEMCGETLTADHSHVVNLEKRSLVCACRPCALLFSVPGAAGGRYRTVPDRCLYDPAFALSDVEWQELQIPVRMAFFFHSEAAGKVVAFYPSPAGATESLLPLDTWQAGLGASPLVARLEPDVEALLVWRAGGEYQCLLVPIDACYELVGLVRLHWKGFDGGAEAWEHIEQFFAGLRAKSRDLNKVA